jgi:hypothetical protein
MIRKISILAPKSGSKEITSQLDLGIEKDTEVNGIGMGVLSDGTPYLNQRGLAALCGVKNAHIGTISSQWGEDPEKPRIASIKAVLGKVGVVPASPHIEVKYKGIVNFCYPARNVSGCARILRIRCGHELPTGGPRQFSYLSGFKTT